MAFRKAERKQAKLRLALSGPSGSGKTYSALLLASGLGGKIAMIDTERGSGDLYADIAKYDICPLDAPFSPARYVELIKEAEKEKYDVLIIDSLSHAWSGVGGVIDIHDKATSAERTKNSWAAWRQVTPQHNELVEAILQSNLHVIVCMRTKTSWEVTEENGKKKPVKIGLAPIQREGIEYEFTTVLDIVPDTHYFSASKDRTKIFKDVHDKITAEHGAKLMKWLNSGRSADDIDYDHHLAMINRSANIDELKYNYGNAYERFNKQPTIMDKLTKAKDAKKEAFTKLTGEQNVK